MQLKYTAEQLEMQPKLEAANINSDSFLATDYLNNFNEIIMLLEMIPDMPEMIEEVADWQPKSYEMHFRDSGFQDTEMAIKAFEIAPPELRRDFDRVVVSLDKLLVSTIAGLERLNIAERGLSLPAQDLIRLRVQNSQDLLLQLSRVIHGRVLEETVEIEESETVTSDDVQSQDDIDKLFD